MESGYRVIEMSQDELRPLFEKYHSLVFDGDHSYSKRSHYSQNEIENMNILSEKMGDAYRLHLGAFDKDDNFVGWSWGFQENSSTYYMCNSAVLEDHRCKGIYRELLNVNINILTEMGFQVIYSRHCVTNNSVIIPKLKAGFVISKMELSDTFGVLVHLHYYTNRARRKIMDYRSGQLKPDNEIKEIFKI